MKILIAAATLAIFSISPASAARTGNSVVPKAPVSSAEVTKYCFALETTGSRLNHVECKTKEEWAKHGVDVDAARRK